MTQPDTASFLSEEWNSWPWQEKVRMAGGFFLGGAGVVLLVEGYTPASVVASIAALVVLSKIEQEQQFLIAE